MAVSLMAVVVWVGFAATRSASVPGEPTAPFVVYDAAVRRPPRPCDIATPRPAMAGPSRVLSSRSMR